jgi:hypothetical protein
LVQIGTPHSVNTPGWVIALSLKPAPLRLLEQKMLYGNE